MARMQKYVIALGLVCGLVACQGQLRALDFSSWTNKIQVPVKVKYLRLLYLAKDQERNEALVTFAAQRDDESVAVVGELLKRNADVCYEMVSENLRTRISAVERAALSGNERAVELILNAMTEEKKTSNPARQHMITALITCAWLQVKDSAKLSHVATTLHYNNPDAVQALQWWTERGDVIRVGMMCHLFARDKAGQCIQALGDVKIGGTPAEQTSIKNMLSAHAGTSVAVA